MATLAPPTLPTPTSSSLLSLLSEPSPQIIKLSLSRLLTQVDSTWHEVAESLPLLEEIAEGGDELEYDDESRKLAAAVASRVYFHLEEPRQALRLALESGEYFTKSTAVGGDVYGDKMMDAAIGEYVRVKRGEAEEEEVDVQKLEDLVSAQFEKCYREKAYESALGVAYESRELNRVKEVLEKCLDGDVVGVLQYAVLTLEGVDKKFRGEALKCVGETIQQLLKGDIGVGAKRTACCLYVKTMQLLNDSKEVAGTLDMLLKDEEEGLLGLQLCFDLIDSGDRRFVDEVAKSLPNGPEGEPATAAEQRLGQAHRIMTSGFTSELHLSFLYKSSNSDPLIMSNLKKALEERSSGLGGRNSILHNAAVCAHGYLNLGTTGDGFLRDNLDWMKKASNWYVAFACFVNAAQPENSWLCEPLPVLIC